VSKIFLQALRGSLTYHDAKRGGAVGIKPSNTVIWIRARVCIFIRAAHRGRIVFRFAVSTWRESSFAVDHELKHPLAFYIPKSESAEEAVWCADIFQSLAAARGWPKNYIKCMALVEAHPLAYQVEEFSTTCAITFLGLNLGRWD